MMMLMFGCQFAAIMLLLMQMPALLVAGQQQDGKCKCRFMLKELFFV
jgi:hypothetical protein